MRVVGEPGRQVGRERGQRIRRRAGPDAGLAFPAQVATDGLAVTAKMAGDRRDRPPAPCQSMNLHVFSLCEHRAGAPSDDGLDTVRLEGAPPQSADVSDDTPRPSNWGDSVIEGGEIPVIVGTPDLTAPNAAPPRAAAPQHSPDFRISHSGRTSVPRGSGRPSWGGYASAYAPNSPGGHRGSPVPGTWYPRRRCIGSRRSSSALRLCGDVLVQTSGFHCLPLGDARALAPYWSDRQGEVVPSLADMIKNE